MNFEEPFVDAVQTVVTPSEADILVARGIVLAAMNDAAEPVVTTDFVDRWLEAVGSRRPAPRTKFTALPAGERGRRLADPDPLDVLTGDVN